MKRYNHLKLYHVLYFGATGVYGGCLEDAVESTVNLEEA